MDIDCCGYHTAALWAIDVYVAKNLKWTVISIYWPAYVLAYVFGIYSSFS